jgi:hypothetical protein
MNDYDSHLTAQIRNFLATALKDVAFAASCCFIFINASSGDKDLRKVGVYCATKGGSFNKHVGFLDLLSIGNHICIPESSF